jgi:SdrD B-like domain
MIVDYKTIGSIVLNPGQSGVNYNFGEAQPVCISGKVFNDSNGNGNCNSGEAGISGVTLTLKDGNGNVLATTTSNSSGSYSFGNLLPGTYSVVESVPSGYTASGTDIGSAGASSSNNYSMSGISLSSGTTGSGYNFGLKKKGS